ncbi:MAG: hypothetical protein M1605_06440 [Candidatus Thermoplasmatota archaeon]|nr:hypothetical protein [Candidatus Thermoplasmatota archaeon]
MNKKYITQAEVLHLIKNKENPTDLVTSNIEFLEKFTRIKNGKKLAEELSSDLKLSDKVSSKIVDLAPESKEELTAILSSYGLMLDDEKLNHIIERVKQEL